MHNQEAHSKTSDSVSVNAQTQTITISDWEAGTFTTFNTTGDVRFDVTDVSHPLNQNFTLTN